MPFIYVEFAFKPQQQQNCAPFEMCQYEKQKNQTSNHRFGLRVMADFNLNGHHINDAIYDKMRK